MQIQLSYYNQHWNIYIYSKTKETVGAYNEWLGKHTTETKPLKEGDKEIGEVRLRTYTHPNIPLYSYGLMLNEPKQRPGHGGEWSSNSRTINQFFGTNLIEAAVDGIAMAVPVDWIKEILGDKVKWETHDIFGWIITDIEGQTEKSDWKWALVYNK